MKRFIKSLLVVIATLSTALAAPPSAPQPPANEETILHASEVYLLKSSTVDGKVHYYIEAVWRHNPQTGPAPAVGAEYSWPGATVGKQPTGELLRFEYNPRLHGRTSGQTVPARDGFVPRFQLSLKDLQDMFRLTQWVPSPGE